MGSSNFEAEVWQYYRNNKRQFPWRQTTDPYRILVSEVMLQQTQTSRVVPYYERFIAQFPNVEALARSSTAELLGLWKGLGYNRRALKLKEAAQKIVSDHKGEVPGTHSELTNLPGIGPNTAGAILAYAFNQDVIFIETNIRKTIIHFFFSNQESVTDSQIEDILVHYNKTENPREWYWALVDYGSMLGRKKIVRNNQSRHYVKQSKFEGSRRQKRSRILQTILAHARLSKKSLGTETGIEDAELKELITELEKEGFITSSAKTVWIKP